MSTDKEVKYMDIEDYTGPARLEFADGRSIEVEIENGLNSDPIDLTDFISLSEYIREYDRQMLAYDLVLGDDCKPQRISAFFSYASFPCVPTETRFVMSPGKNLCSTLPLERRLTPQMWGLVANHIDEAALPLVVVAAISALAAGTLKVTRAES